MTHPTTETHPLAVAGDGHTHLATGAEAGKVSGGCGVYAFPPKGGSMRDVGFTGWHREVSCPDCLTRTPG